MWSKKGGVLLGGESFKRYGRNGGKTGAAGNRKILGVIARGGGTEWVQKKYRRSTVSLGRSLKGVKIGSFQQLNNLSRLLGGWLWVKPTSRRKKRWVGGGVLYAH